LAIRNGDCDAAVVIGATTHVHPSAGAYRAKAGIASPSGKCLPFSQWADGFVPGEGAAAIVLQKCSDAVIDPYAVLRASATTQDGASRGFRSPNPVAQSRLLQAALDRANCKPDALSFLEGTYYRIGIA